MVASSKPTTFVYYVKGKKKSKKCGRKKSILITVISPLSFAIIASDTMKLVYCDFLAGYVGGMGWKKDAIKWKTLSEMKKEKLDENINFVMMFEISFDSFFSHFLVLNE